MNKGLWFVEMLEDDITRGSATLSLVRGQFNDTGLARGKCRIFPTQRHISHITRHQPWHHAHHGNLENSGDRQEEK